ncbi:MAG: HAMP domain-containing sensor histidine kinase [Campylobacterota bacterium]
MLNKFSDKLSTCSPLLIITVMTTVIVISSIPLVYLLTILFGGEYSTQMFIMSVVAPVLMAPPTLAVMIKMSKHLKHFKEQLDIDNSYGGVELSSSISQVILNLLSNAKDTFEEDSKRKEIKLQLTTNEYGLEIECCDNGVGIEEEIKDKIFNPYFSTKGKAQGTGIGLYMSKEIVQKIFNGKIDVSSREYSRSSRFPLDNSGKTCFYIAIPYSENCLLKEDYE